MNNDYSTYIHQSRYARYLWDEGRRETWPETVGRYIAFWIDRLDSKFSGPEYDEAANAILNFDVMPSMRALMTAGKALERDHCAGYNCSYIPIDRYKSFDELMYVLLCGTGVGFSVERQYVSLLPEIPDGLYKTGTTIVVADSKIGWASSFRELVALLYSGKVPKWDMSKVRPAGSPLKVFGGRASGPEPLEDLFEYTVRLFTNASGRKLNSLECHDLCCKVASVVVVGGVRRSALISLSNLSDPRMAAAKTGAWYEEHPYRSYANNSVCYTEHPDTSAFMKEWLNLYESRCGERGFFSRVAAKNHIGDMPDERRNPFHEWGTNPCSEILLRPRQFCNLSEVVCRPDDTLEDLKYKIRIATMIGTWQSTLTDFRYLNKEWKNNCEEERLLGVSLTGIMDHAVLSEPREDWLKQLRQEAIDANAKHSAVLDINPSAGITCVKPSGTVSQLVDASSGIHPRYSQYYVRRTQADINDPLTSFLKDQGVPGEALSTNKSTWVFEWPMKSPNHSVLRDDMSALGQLEHWKVFAKEYCEHKPSITCYVREDEWIEVGAWVFKNFDIMSGVSFLPHTDHIYKQAPYEEIEEDKYAELVKRFPKIDWSAFKEEGDNTTSSQELSCTGAEGCDI